MPNQLRSSATPVAWMFAGVLLGSLFPLFVEFVPTHSVLLSAAGILLGQSVGVVIYIALFHRDLVADKALLRLFLLRALPWPFIGHAARVNDPRRQLFGQLSVVCVLAQMSTVLYIFSTLLIDTSVTAILNATWPILFVILLSRQDRTTGRYRTVSLESFAILMFAFFGLIFVILGTTDNTSAVRLVPVIGQMAGISLALLSPVLGSLNAKTFRWGSEMTIDLRELNHYRANTETHKVELACVILATGIGTFGASLVTLGIAMVLGERIGVIPLIAALAFGMVGRFGTQLCFRIANLGTRDLMVNTVAYTMPLFALLWLALFSDIQVGRIDYIAIGATAIIAVNLLLNLDPEHRSGRYGFKSLILALWTSGVVVFLRDRWFTNDIVWGGGEYWGMVGVSATVFILILSFRISRLVARTSTEEYQTLVLLRKLEAMVSEGVIDKSVQELLFDISTAKSASELQEPYSKMRQQMLRARKTGGSEMSKGEMADIEAELDALVNSKQQGSEFSELVAVIVFGVITVALTLLARPAVEGWFGFLTEMFVVLLGATVVFLVFNLADMRRERYAGVFKVDAFPEAPGYAVSLRSGRILVIERTLSLIIGFGIVVAFGVLLYIKWLLPQVYLHWWS